MVKAVVLFVDTLLPDPVDSFEPTPGSLRCVDGSEAKPGSLLFLDVIDQTRLDHTSPYCQQYDVTTHRREEQPCKKKDFLFILPSI